MQKVQLVHDIERMRKNNNEIFTEDDIKEGDMPKPRESKNVQLNFTEKIYPYYIFSPGNIVIIINPQMMRKNVTILGVLRY